MKKNISEIMRNAHTMTKTAVVKYPGANYAATFSAALRICWNEYGKTAADLWRDMSGDEQYNALMRMTYHAKKRDNAREFPRMDWMTADDLQTVVNESYICAVELFSRPSNENKPLSLLLYAAVEWAVIKIVRAERKAPKAIKSRADDNGEQAEYIIDNAAPVAEHTVPAPEQYAIIKDLIEQAAGDAVDREIIAMRASGYNQAEIAAALGVNQSSVARRLQKIKDRYSAA